MDPVFRKEIMPGVNLTCVKTDKFKTGCISINFISKLEAATASKNALLPKVLCRGTAMHPDMESLSAAKDDLYGASISPIVRKLGEKHVFGLYATFVDDDFLPKGENILEKTAQLCGEILLSPETKAGKLLDKYVESERENLINAIKSQVNDKRSYAVTRLVEKMCAGEAFAVTKLGTAASASKITAAGLTKHYKKVISECPVEIFYCGAASSSRVELAMLEALSSMPRFKIADVETENKNSYAGKVRYFTEELDVTQGNLAIGYRIDSVIDEQTLPVLMVTNAVFGGSVTSKLFMNVREKLSLCYYASSSLQKQKGLMLVSSGIKFEKYQDALDEIRAQLQAVCRGDFTDEELAAAAGYVVTNMKLWTDEPDTLEQYYLGQAVSKMNVPPLDAAAQALLVTREQVMDMASKLTEDSVYFLKNREDEHEV